jgi:hypothetical protein
MSYTRVELGLRIDAYLDIVDHNSFTFLDKSKLINELQEVKRYYLMYNEQKLKQALVDVRKWLLDR